MDKNNCPLESSCLKQQCDAEKLITWQAQNSNESHGTQRLAGQLARINCKR